MIVIIKNPVHRFRTIALIEGLSFLLLLFISMPLKYYFEMPQFNPYVGAIHGGLFVLYVIFAIEIMIRRKISILQFARVIFASIIPFGTFFNDKMLKVCQENDQSVKIAA